VQRPCGAWVARLALSRHGRQDSPQQPRRERRKPLHGDPRPLATGPGEGQEARPGRLSDAAPGKEAGIGWRSPRCGAAWR
jgi:hypothetical protein